MHKNILAAAMAARSARGSLASIVALSLTSLVACSSGNSAAPGSDAGSTTDGTVQSGGGGTALPCDVAAAVTTCQSCHGATPTNGAPMSLTSWEDFHAALLPDAYTPDAGPGAEVWQGAQLRIHDTQSPMPPPPFTLTSAQTATLDSWFAAGAPKTDGATCGGGGEDGGPGAGGDSSVAQPDAATPLVACNASQTPATLAPTSAWTMPQTDTDDYVCYSVTIPPTVSGATDHVLAISPNIMNHKIVHHVLLFQADPTDTSITTTPTKCNPGGSLGWRVVYAWAPGGGAMQTPANVGFPYDATTKWVVQVHYNNINGLSGETDMSGFSLCTTDQPVQYDADVVAFGNMDFQIPPLSTYDSTCAYTIDSKLAGVHAFAAFPHMHTLGQAIQTEQTLADGGLVGMTESIPWNFNTQIWFPIDTVLNAGDVVTTRCAWQNSTTNMVPFGQDTEQEMCYSFTAYYPKVTTGGWSWALPAEASSPTTCQTSTDGGLPLLPTPSGGWAAGTFDDAGAGSN